MRAFAALYRVLDASTFSLAKQASLQRYLHAVPLQDPASAVYCLGGGRSLVDARDGDGWRGRTQRAGGQCVFGRLEQGLEQLTRQ